MRSKLPGLAAFAVFTLTWGAALAGPNISLVSKDGSTTIDGELLDYDGKAYMLRTAVGTVKIDAAQVRCIGEGCPGQSGSGATIDLAGSNVIGDGLMAALIEGYGDSLDGSVLREVGVGVNEHTYRVIDGAGAEIVAIGVSAHGTATGYPALADGSAAIALASSRMNGNEAGVGDLRDTPGELILALDGLVVIVHPENPVRAVTLDQLAAIFAGRITDWAELGGHEQAINLYAPDRNSGTLQVFEDLVMRPRQGTIADSAELFEDHADLADLVAIDPGGIGVTSVALTRGARALSIRQACGLISPATTFAIKTEEYPLGRRLYAYAPPAMQTLRTKALTDFALSDAAQPLLSEAGFVDRGIEAQSIEVQGARLANSILNEGDFVLPVFREMLAELKDGERLSITFRFNPGSSELETRSQSEAERFARLLVDGAYRGKDVLLVGFADSVGDFAVNRGLAERRAQSVLETIKATLPPGALDAVPIRVQSYGELTPVGCNETSWGRELNRRVEVWVRDSSR